MGSRVIGENLFIRLLFHTGAVSNEKWRCTSNPDNGLMFPELQESDLNSSLWEDSLVGASYVYPVPAGQGGCSGSVTGLDFCYRVLTSINSTRVHVFTLLVLDLSSDYGRVLSSSEIYASLSTNTSRCRPSEDNLYCCGFTELTANEKFQFPVTSFALGITTSDSTAVVLQQFQNSPDKEMFTVLSSFVTNTSAWNRTFNSADVIMSNVSFQAVRLQIGKL